MRLLRSLNGLFLALEFTTLLAGAVLLAVGLRGLQDRVRSSFLSRQQAEIDKVDLLAEMLISEKKRTFEAFLAAGDGDRLVGFLSGFSDVYRLDERLRVSTIVKKEPESALFVGYDLGASRLGHFVSQVTDQAPVFAGLDRSIESEQLSVFLCARSGPGWLVARIGLEKLEADIGRLAALLQSTLVLATRDGYVLFATRQDFPVDILPSGRDRSLELEGTRFFYARRPSRVLNADVAVLTPESQIYAALASVSSFMLAAAALLVALLAAKTLLERRLVVRPLAELSALMERFQVDAPPPRPSKGLLWLRESESVFRRFLDLADRIRTEVRRLRENESRLYNERQRLAVTLRSLGDGVVATDTAGAVVLLNPSAEVLTGWPAAEAQGQPLAEVLALSGAEVSVPELLAAVLGERRAIRPEGLPVLRGRDGVQRGIALSGAPIIDDSGAAIGAIVVFRDVTERRRFESELARMRAYLKHVIDAMPSVLVSVDERGQVREWNAAAERETGVPAAQALGRPFWEASALLAEFREALPAVLAATGPREWARTVTREAEVRHQAVALLPLRTNGDRGMVIRLDDVTALAHKEQQLRQAQKMETLGTLVGGLAHDFNNVLAGVVSAASLLRDEIDTRGAITPAELNGYLDLIEHSGQRATDMVRQMLALARRQDLAFAPLDLNESLRQVLAICRNTFDKSVALAVHFAEEPAVVKADAGQLEQVLLNLCVNGMHAMTLMRAPGEAAGGTLTVRVYPLVADAAFCAAHPRAREGAYWVVEVVDTGVGMSEATQAKIFDPFFTTKDKGSGTGLGLTMAYNIVEQHQGWLSVSSQPGRGSRFSVYLPRAEATPAAAGAAAPKVQSGQGTILVIDDEPLLRRLAAAILQRAGYRFLLADGGEEGLRLFQEKRGEISAVLLDLSMPHMSGADTFRELRKLDPGVKVLLSSGFRHDERVDALLAEGVKGFLQKPFTVATLSQALRELLQGA